jgi:cyclopropane fatty-acyl-phospholipid synthase-like methyltransferase
MNEYDLIAPFYDIEHDRFNEDLDMYRNFAELSGGKILELACGSGRVLLPFVEEGYELTGVDSSEKMLEIAQQRLQEKGLAGHCQLIKQDMRTLQLGQKYRLAIIALGSFGHITTRKAQQSTLAAIRAHLSPGATLLLDISNADARYMEDLSGQVLHQGTWPLQDGYYYTHFVSPAASSERHLLELTHFYERHQQGGPVERTVITTHLYLFEHVEVELLLEQAGFVVKDVYGDYDLGSFGLESSRMICVAEVH